MREITMWFVLGVFVFGFYILRGTVDDAPAKYTEEEKSRKNTNKNKDHFCCWFYVWIGLVVNDHWAHEFWFFLLVVVVQVRSEMIVCVCVWFDFLCIEPMSHTESISENFAVRFARLLLFCRKVIDVNQSHSRENICDFFSVLLAQNLFIFGMR